MGPQQRPQGQLIVGIVIQRLLSSGDRRQRVTDSERAGRHHQPYRGEPAGQRFPFENQPVPGVSTEQWAGIGQLQRGARGGQRRADLAGSQPGLRVGGPSLELDEVAGDQSRGVAVPGTPHRVCTEDPA